MRTEVKVGTLPNGLKFYSLYDWSGTTNLAGIGVKVGSIHTPPGCVGLPHLVEHLLARESLKYPPLEAELIFEKFLGDPDDNINIRIDRVSTNYGFGDLLKRKDALICLDVMAHFLRDKILTAEGIAVELAAVHNEYHLRGMDNMSSLLDDCMHSLMYEKNPAGFRIDCEVGDLKKITRSQITRFIKKHYVLGNMFLVALGYKFEDVRELAKEYFDDWEVKPAPELRYDHSDDLPILTNVRSCDITRNIGQYHLAIGFPTENYMSKDSEALDVLARILAFRLRQRLREGNRKFDGGVYRANVYTSRSFLHGLIYSDFATTSKEFAKRSQDIVLEEIAEIKNGLIDDRELEAMVYYLDTDYVDVFRRKIAERLSEMIIESVCNGDEDLVQMHTFRDRLHKVTAKKIRNVANKYFAQGYARVVIGPTIL